MKNTNDRSIHNRRILYIFMLLILAVNIYRLYVEFRWDNIGFDDHAWIWRECRVAFWHYSPYQALADHSVIQGIQMEAHISSLPWGLVLGTLMHGAFLPYEMSCIWYIIVRLLTVLVTAVLVWKSLEREQVNHALCFIAMLAIPATWYAIDCISKANNGEIICLFIICALCILEKQPVIAGILMTFAMFKPQTALPFFLLFLLQKRYKTIITSVIGVLGCWGASAVWTGENPFAQLQGVIKFANNMEASYHVVGIMDPIRKLGVGNSLAMILSMLVGIVIMCICLWKNRCKQNFIIYAFPAVTSVMWCYKSAQDYLILLIVVYAVVELWLDEQDYMQTILLLVLIGMSITKPFSSALLGRLPILDMYMCNRLDLIMKTLIMPLLVFAGIRRDRLVNKT